MVRINKRIEKEQVLIPCLSLCRKLLGAHVLQYRRLDALDSYHISGSPDIEIWISKESYLWIIMAECKIPSGGILSDKQMGYRDKYTAFKNIIYSEIRDVVELKKLILSNSDYGCEKLSEFENIKDL